MQNTLKLFMVLVGFKQKGMNTEQHDVRFVVGTSVEEDPLVHKSIREQLSIPLETKIHIDSYVDINYADGHEVKLVYNPSADEPQNKNLFFVNLGGYKNNEFKEHHKPLLLVAEKQTEAIKRALVDTFVYEMDTPHPKARPHKDDDLNVGADVDDYLNVAENVSKSLKGHRIVLIPKPGGKDSILTPVITGYMKLEV